jgi:hypothetical protein
MQIFSEQRRYIFEYPDRFDKIAGYQDVQSLSGFLQSFETQKLSLKNYSKHRKCVLG